MSSDLEQRLRDAFQELPSPAREVSARARRAVLATLPPRRRGRGGWVVAVAFAVAAVVGVTAGALAATGKLHVQLGSKPAQTAETATSRLVLPRGTHGFAVVADGRLWLATRRGLRIEGLPVSAAELSPHALYAVVGIGTSLVVLAPRQRHAWAHETGGRVVAAAWRPDGLQIAYVVARRGRYELRLIEGDGDHDHLVDARVAPVKPSWRSDLLAVAYVGAGGRVIVYDLGHRSRRIVRASTSCAGGRVLGLAFAPRDGRLAFNGSTGVGVWNPGRKHISCAGGALGLTGVAWLSEGEALVTTETPRGIGLSFLRRYQSSSSGPLRTEGEASSDAPLVGLSAPPWGWPVAVATLPPGQGTMIVRAAPPSVDGVYRFRPGVVLLRLPKRAGRLSIIWR
ncbi:MAG: hypothetical protein WBB74_08050 [Gaiellaceae bacterium]